MEKALITDALRAVQSRDGLDNNLIKSLPDDLKAKIIGTRYRNSAILTVATTAYMGIRCLAHQASASERLNPSHTHYPHFSTRIRSAYPTRAPDTPPERLTLPMPEASSVVIVEGEYGRI